MAAFRRHTAWVMALCMAGLTAAVADSGPSPPTRPRSNILVIYYSRTGTTAKLAEAIAASTGADVERLQDTVLREGAMGFLRSLKDAMQKRGTTLKPLQVDPTAYAIVVVGTPDWGQSVSAPVRTLLQSYRGRLRSVAFFLTDGTADHTAIFQEMADLVGAQPVATLGIPRAEVEAGRYTSGVERFTEQLQAALAREPRIDPAR